MENTADLEMFVVQTVKLVPNARKESKAHMEKTQRDTKLRISWFNSPSCKDPFKTRWVGLSQKKGAAYLREGAA
jgi:hypothetical protein